jgi:hypothetical protein
MSFIQKTDATVINTKLTSIGRLLLASGQLTFKKIEFGDSEINYTYLREYDPDAIGTDYLILRPKDLNPQIKSKLFINTNNTESKKDITSINPIVVNVVNTAKERGFFTGVTQSFTSITSTTHILGTTTINLSGVTGGTTVRLASTSAITTGNTILIDWRNPALSAASISNNSVTESIPRVMVWYKVVGKNSNIITVDKPLPNFNGNGSSVNAKVYIFPTNNAVDNYYSTGTTVSYWNDNTLAFNSNCNISNDDIPVWNFNIVHTDTVLGTQNGYTSIYYDSYVFEGFKEYIQGQSTNSGKTQLGIVHYTNNSISNYYGEAFYNDTFKIDLPTVMFHVKTASTMGVTLKSYGTKKTLPTNNTGFTTEYYDLVESTSNFIVGKVFNDLKMCIIEDEELLMALSLKSNRNYTIPNANWQKYTATPSEISNNNLLLNPSSPTEKYLAITYMFKCDNLYDVNVDLGYSTPLFCGYINKFYAGTQPENIQFNFNSSDLKYLTEQAGIPNGTGFTVGDFTILAQLVNVGSEPDPTLWKEINFTSSLTGFGTWNGTCIPKYALTDTIYRLDYAIYTAGTTFNLSNYTTLPTVSDLSGLGFGEESILYGNINTDIKAVVYKTQIVEILNLNEYNSSSNTTWQDGDDVFISEVGIYDVNDNLVMVGKLSNPIKKNNGILFTINLDIDF